MQSKMKSVAFNLQQKERRHAFYAWHSLVI